MMMRAWTATLKPRLGLLLLACFGLVLTGCGGYALQGRVIEGPQPAVLVVSKNDSRLKQPGIGGASLMLTIDPDSLNAKMLPMDMADDQGWFATPVDVTGAGLLEYDVQVVCRAAGYTAAARTLPLPAGHKRLLIVLPAGADRYKPQGDILQETIDIGKQLAPGQ